MSRKAKVGYFVNFKKAKLPTKQRLEGNYSNGFKNGLWTRWYGNGVTASEYTYDNTTFDGQVTEWHIDKECWDNKGNPCECGASWWDNCEKHK